MIVTFYRHSLLRGLIIPLMLCALLTVSSPVPASGISVAQQDGKSIYFYKDYHALVVGVGNYENWPVLPSAVLDAREISSFLRQRGFKVTLVTDPTSLELKKALNDFIHGVGQEQDRGILFFYAGHGETQILEDGTKLGWIVPRDCPTLSDDPRRFPKLAISTRDIERFSTQIRSRHVLMLFDSAFSGTFFSVESPVLETITEKSALPVRQYIIAGKEDEPMKAPSVFKRFLLKGLEGDADLIYDGYITGSELANYLTDRVEKNTRDRQHPRYGKFKHAAFARGDFIFHLALKEPDTGRLFIQAEPEKARVRILNIGPRFSQGIELAGGKYHVEVSAEGYQTAKQWITLEAGKDKTVEVRLSKREDVVTNSLGMKFVLIRPGSFLMGSSDDEPGGSRDETNHRVTLSERYYMQTTEVTVALFKKFVKETGYRTEGEKTGGCWVSTEGGRWRKKKGSNWKNPASWQTAASPQTDSHPVTCVSWNDAQAFAVWLSRKDGKTYSLPTEAEWEYACRAGTKTPFAFGRCLSSGQANYGGTGPSFSECKDSYRENRKKPLSVSSLSPNPWGLFDMHGNVSEWVQDRYGPYPPGPVKNPKGPTFGTDRVMRGGHFLADAGACRSAKRNSFPPAGASDAIGFRLIMRP